MKAFYSAVLLFVLLPLCGFSQETKDGFIIINNGQFKYGSIQIDNSDRQHTECLFKESSKSEFKKYSSEEIEGYGVINGNKFLRREIDITSQRKNVFLKTEFEGLIKLYSYHERIFVEETEFIELQGAQNVFRNSLTELLKSCQNINSLIKRTSFDIKSIQFLLERYQQCANENFVFSKRIKMRVEGFVGVELNSTQLTSNILLLDFANNEPLNDQTLLSLGLRINVSLSKIESLSLGTGLYYYQQKFYLLSTSGTNPVKRDKLNLEYTEFLVPINVQYTFLKDTKKLRPYLRAGVSIPFILNPMLILEHEEASSNVVYYDQYDAMKSYHQSLQIDIAGGVNFNISKRLRSFVELQFGSAKGEIMTSFSNTEEILSKTKRLSIVVGLQF